MDVVFVQFALMVVCVFVNIFGIFILRKQKGGNVNQRLVLQNLSCIEIVKICYDFFSLTVYYFHKEWITHTYAEIVMTIELTLMTVIFCSFILISLERIAFFLLVTQYKYYITKKVATSIIMATWIIGFCSGPIFWLGSLVPGNARMYYYISFDIVVIILNMITFAVTLKEVQTSRQNPRLRRNRSVNQSDRSRLAPGQARGLERTNSQRQQRREKNVKLYVVSLLIVTSFSCFNAIPDFVFEFYKQSINYVVVSILWSIGYLSDPIIYIFMNRKVRKDAKQSVKRISTTVINDIRSRSPSPCTRREQTDGNDRLLPPTRDRYLTVSLTIDSMSENESANEE